MRSITISCAVLLAATTAGCFYPELNKSKATDAAWGVDGSARADIKAAAPPDADARSPEARTDLPRFTDGVPSDIPMGADFAPDQPFLPDGAASKYDGGADRGPDAPITAIDSGPGKGETGPSCPTSCDDNLLCTTDTCPAGACQNTLNPGYCKIDNVCYMDGDRSPADACMACSLTSSTSQWTAQPEGSACGPGRSCQSNACAPCGSVGQACCGASPGTCVVGAACDPTANTCTVDKAIDISGAKDTFCALFQSGRVRCWGTNGDKLGVSAAKGSSIAAPPVTGLVDAVQLSVGYNAVCAVRATGTVVCWGYAPGSTTSASAPVAVPGISNAKQVSVGASHACVTTADNKVLCWGQNSKGQFGNGVATTTASTSPTQMSSIVDALSVAAAAESTCVLRMGGQVSCTGAAYGNGLTVDSTSAADLAGIAGASALSGISSGPWNAWFCATDAIGTLYCWGQGNGLGRLQPQPVSGLGRVVSAVSDQRSYWAIQQDGTLWVLGENACGQLGDGSHVKATTAVLPRLAHDTGPLSGVARIALASSGYREVSGGFIGLATACLLRGDGSVSCAGFNGGYSYPGSGARLGDGEEPVPADRSYFVPVVGILPVASEDGQCFDGADNDGNGKIDLEDPACAQDLGTAIGSSVVTAPFTGLYGNYLQESCNPLYSSSRYGGPEAMLTWTAPSGGTFQLDTNGSSFDTVLAAYKGSPLTSAELACNDDGSGLASGASAIQVRVVTGDKLTIVIDSKSAPLAAVAFNLNITKL